MNFKPMLAKEADLDNLPFSTGYMQPKIDGLRAYAYINDIGELVFKTKTGKIITSLPEVSKEAEHFLVRFLTKGDVIDGELYIPGADLSDVMSHVKRKTPLPTSYKVIFIVFDYFYPINKDTPFETRMRNLLLLDFPELRNVKGCETVKFHNVEQIKGYHTSKVKEGYEGIMLRDSHSPYVRGRTNKLLKYKLKQIGLFRIINVTTGKGKFSGLGIFECVTKDGVVFPCVLNTTNAALRSILLNKEKYIEKVLEVEYLTMTYKGSVREPRGLAVWEDADVYYRGMEVGKNNPEDSCPFDMGSNAAKFWQLGYNQGAKSHG